MLVPVVSLVLTLGSEWVLPQGLPAGHNGGFKEQLVAPRHPEGKKPHIVSGCIPSVYILHNKELNRPALHLAPPERGVRENAHQNNCSVLQLWHSHVCMST